MTKFYPKYVAKKLGIEDAHEAYEVAKKSTDMGRLPDTTHRGTEYIDGYALEWVWLDHSDWIVERVHAHRYY